MGITERPEAMSLAHRGLAEAAWRTLDSARRKHLLSCAVAATEALHWACALDEQLRKEDAGYEARRDQDPDGRTLPGLRHVRDRAMHQVVIGTGEDTRSFSSPRRGVVHVASSYPIWVPTNIFPAPDRNHRSASRETSYEAHVAERGAWKPLFEALGFLTRELEGKLPLMPIEQPEWYKELSVEERTTIGQGSMLLK